MIRIEIEGHTADDVREQILRLLCSVPAPEATPHVAEAQFVEVNPTAPAADPQQPSLPLEPAARRGRPRKAQAEPPAVSATAPAPADEAPAAVPEQPITQKAAPTAEDARAALTRFVASKGVDAGRALLAEFITEPGAKIQLPNLKPEQYADFIARCL